MVEKEELIDGENLDKNELQLAENLDVDQDESTSDGNFEEKRKLLEKTKIVKQTWSILEIYQKIKSTKLILSPDYQRNSIWKIDKQTAFIESLFMDILVPPIYVVEIPGDDVLEDSTYEVVDGKQRLTAINDFVTNKYSLDTKSLEYFADLYSEKKFFELQSEFPESINALLSSVLDIYVITANSPEFTKYDIFSRLNKGSEKLKVNEIRKAIYRSSTLKLIESFASYHLSEKKSAPYDLYTSLFSDNDIKRYEDYGRFYRSIAFFVRSEITDNSSVIDYNSRPRDMINNVLQEIQMKKVVVDEETINRILEFTLNFGVWLKDKTEKNRLQYIIDAIIPFVNKVEKFEDLEVILKDPDFENTFIKSAATTTNVNNRLKIVTKYLA